MEQNYFILKKKLKECDEIKELDNFSNKEAVIQKISGLLNMIFYSNIYETLYKDMVNEKDLLGKYLDDLIEKCESVIATLNTDKKIQLGMCICDPNFNQINFLHLVITNAKLKSFFYFNKLKK